MDAQVAWLRAQFDEDEVWASRLPNEAGQIFNGEQFVDAPNRVRMLREVEAKRQMLDEHLSYYGEGSDANWPVRVLTWLTLPYAHRPGYRDEWKP